ncbi:MAG: tetratricopeptide repeat protein [Candidatus Eremiobacteraeota bacterium]|nr:tetratricopeptide repeat protein [Candidatus Eremiobacteraeota bacterium]
MRFARVLTVVAALVLSAFAILQLASGAIFAGSGAPFSVPAHLSLQFGVNVYRALEHIWAPPFVEAMLARAALDQGDVAAAREHVLKLPPSQTRSALEGRVALASGQHAAAVADFVAALDIAQLEREVDRLQGSGELTQAYQLENLTRARLMQAGTHPDAVAESFWRSGVLARALADRRQPPEAKWLRVALDDYRQAYSLAPWSGKYWLEAGTGALVIGEYDNARHYYQRAVEVDPRMADAYAGLGVIALHEGDRQSALQYAARSRALNPASTMLRRLDRSLQ